jgi:hypothetical protein
MVRTAVSSTSLVSVGYNEEKQLLEVEFVNGGVYQYGNVPPEVYEALMAAESHGTYFAKNIRNEYLSKRVS